MTQSFEWLQQLDNFANPMSNLIGCMKNSVSNIGLPIEQRNEVIRKLKEAEEAIRRSIQLAEQYTYEMEKEKDREMDK